MMKPDRDLTFWILLVLIILAVMVVSMALKLDAQYVRLDKLEEVVYHG